MLRFFLLALAVLTASCGKEMVIGADPAGDVGVARDAGDVGAARDAGNVGAARDAGLASSNADASTDALLEGGLEPLVVPWSTGFETGNFDDWSEPPEAGYCYVAGSGSRFDIVTTPVHSGKYAAAFQVDTSGTSGSLPPEASQTRCVRQGAPPSSAYYGAWYYVPATALNYGDWNLFHFQGADSSSAPSEYLWDVSLVNGVDGSVATQVLDFLRPETLTAGPSIPIGTWFHLEVRWTRAATNTGEFTVYIDGNSVLDLTKLETGDTRWGQWFVGNYATWLSPALSTVYVDDVTIETSGP